MVPQGTTPATPGLAGGWTLVTGTSHIEDRDTGLPDCWWDEGTQKLHVLSWHTTPKYSVFTLSGGSWSGSTINSGSGGETIGVITGSQPSGAFVKDTVSRIWAPYYASGTLTLETAVRTCMDSSHTESIR